MAAYFAGAAQEPVRSEATADAESLPAPNREDADEPVVGQLEHSGWGLNGAHGRHYVFGGLAIADYTWRGMRHIVTLQQEEPTLLEKPDDNFLYYRELGAGHRWAIGRYPSADDTYAIYFQPQPEQTQTTDAKPPAKPKWSLFQRARLMMPEQQPAAVANPAEALPLTGGRTCSP